MTLKLTLERDVEPKEVTSLIYGTGALSWPWWRSARWMRGETQLLTRDYYTDQAQEYDWFEFVVDDPNEEGGSGVALTRALTMQDILTAAALAIREGLVNERDAINDDLGYCDAIEADCILQLAVLGSVTYG